jgi:hypothetical protein
MKNIVAGDIDRDGFQFNLFLPGDFEFVNPIQWLYKLTFQNSINFDLQMFKLHKDSFLKGLESESNIEEIIKKKFTQNALRHWLKIYNEILSEKLPANLIDILTCNNKSEQFKILRNIKLSRSGLTLLTFKAFEEFGFTYSTYRIEHLPSGINPKDLPSVAYKEHDGSITIAGNTILTRVELKRIIEQRKVVILKFMEKDSLWHCFFYTQNALLGKEAGKAHRHMHYVSNCWNFSREEALQKLRETHYPFSSIPHIEYIED